ncbi:GNAT family N-acetyltransferase [Martelella soudanensis]|uniref:GNAT family N-acetyltransferase n=1 Tax=unclassified Martelella TaxID=2629616 RepID=UPI0015DEB013|nr:MULTISPECIES: GNAT family N-acetyltransferase [unclassified Martelella]
MTFTVDIARLDALTAGELHDVFRLRIEVFVVEQACPYPELDGKDPQALHLRLLDEGRLAAYARIFAAGETAPEARIGRVVVAPGFRGRRLGERVMREAIAACGKLSPSADIAISAQAHLQRFYGSLGFSVTSAEYLEDGIPHVDMVRAAESIAS